MLSLTARRRLVRSRTGRSRHDCPEVGYAAHRARWQNRRETCRFRRSRPEAVIRSGWQARGTARASASVVAHPEHEIFHPLKERMFLFNLIGSVVEPHVVHRTLALSCNDFHDVLSKWLAGGISHIA